MNAPRNADPKMPATPRHDRTNGRKHGTQRNGPPAPPPAAEAPAPEIQAFGTMIPMPIGLDESACQASVEALNQVLADTMALRDLYKKHHWQLSGPSFYALHLMFDKHFNEQSELVDEIAERIQSLGGISIAMAHDVAERTRIARPPQGRESAPRQIARLLEAHEMVLKEARMAARAAAAAGDDGTNDLLVSDVIKTGEMQVWFLAAHVMDTPHVSAACAAGEVV